MLRQAVNLAPLEKDNVPVQQQAELEDDGAWQDDSAGPTETWQVSLQLQSHRMHRPSVQQARASHVQIPTIILLWTTCYANTDHWAPTWLLSMCLVISTTSLFV